MCNYVLACGASAEIAVVFAIGMVGGGLCVGVAYVSSAIAERIRGTTRKR